MHIHSFHIINANETIIPETHQRANNEASNYNLQSAIARVDWLYSYTLSFSFLNLDFRDGFR